MRLRAGEVAEWSKAHAWKACIRQRIEGSNPSLSAIFSSLAPASQGFTHGVIGFDSSPQALRRSPGRKSRYLHPKKLQVGAILADACTPSPLATTSELSVAALTGRVSEPHHHLG